MMLMVEDFSAIAARLRELEQGKVKVYSSIQEAVDAAVADKVPKAVRVTERAWKAAPLAPGDVRIKHLNVDSITLRAILRADGSLTFEDARFLP